MSFYHDQPLISREEFQKLILERTAVRKEITKRKRQEWLNEIDKRKSKTGINPLELFPKEIWLQILTELDHDDLWNTWQVHPVFTNLVESNWDRASDILFPQALKLVLDYIKNNDYTVGWNMRFVEPEDEINDDDDEDIIVLPQEGTWRGPYLTGPLLKLREVSKSFRLTVDRWFQAKVYEELHLRSEDSPTNWRKLPRLQIQLLSNEDMGRCHALIQSYSAAKTDDDDDGDDDVPAKSENSFFFRSIQVDISLDDRDQTDYDNFIAEDDQPHLRSNTFLPSKAQTIKLLQLVGDQILFFKLRVSPIKYFDIAGIPLADIYELLQACCMLTPNLIHLEVSLEIGDGYSSCEDHEFSDEVLENLVHSLETFSFPTLSKLEKVTLKQDYKLIEASGIYDAILKANPHVKMLHVKLEDEVFQNVNRDVLECLDLKFFSWKNNAPTSNSNDLFFRKWPLQALELWPRSQDLKSVFELLHEFPLLEKVTLDMSDVKVGTGVPFLNLPKLTHFHCRFSGRIDFEKDDVNFLFSLQFLIHAKKLQKLRWCYEAVTTDDKKDQTMEIQEYLKKHECPEERADFRGGWRNLRSSNIWKIFPELESVDIEFFSYSTCTNARRYYRP